MPLPCLAPPAASNHPGQELHPGVGRRGVCDLQVVAEGRRHRRVTSSCHCQPGLFESGNGPQIRSLVFRVVGS